MAIEFACPNGHRLSCSDDRAGTQGKCPKCGVGFQVPSVSSPAASPPPRTPAPPSSAGEGDSAVLSNISRTSATQIQFLCPNGHRLNGPLALQGQPGQCPHCGAKFRIPFVDADDPEGSTISSGVVEEGSELEEVEEVDEVSDVEDDPYTPATEQLASFLPPPVNEEADHSLARLFPLLWNEKHHGAVLEIHMGDGVILIPDWWAERQSMEDYVVFALQTADGSYVMEAVAWSAIKRITVRRISELPGGVFD